MIDYHRFCQIKHLQAHDGLNASQIAQAVSLDRRTVAYWLTQEHFHPRKPRPHASKLDPFKPDIVRLLERHPYSAAQVFQRLREHSFDGSYELVKAYVRTVRPRRQAAFLTLAFAPGECAQVDWGAFGSVPVGQTHRQLSFFVMVLCHSRMLYVEFTVSQTMEHFLACHQHAFDFFGGIPRKVMVDNLKSAVLKRAVGDAPVLNPKYLDFATHHGFTITPCNVGKGNGKRPGGKRRRVREKEFPRWSGDPRLQRPQSRRPALARYRGQCAPAWRNPGATDRVMAHRATILMSRAAASLRYRHRVPGPRLPTISHYRRDQPLFRPRAVRRPRLDIENLSRSSVSLAG